MNAKWLEWAESLVETTGGMGVGIQLVGTLSGKLAYIGLGLLGKGIYHWWLSRENIADFILFRKILALELYVPFPEVAQAIPNRDVATFNKVSCQYFQLFLLLALVVLAFNTTP